VVVEPSVASRTAGDLLGIGLAGLLVIEENQEAQAFPLLSYCATDVVATLAQEPGGLYLQQPHAKQDTRALMSVC
jgi:hypothetical protein